MKKIKKIIRKVLLVILGGGMFVSGNGFQSKVYAANDDEVINLDCVKGFSYFFLENFNCSSMHTQGKMAVGGVLTSKTNLSICTDEVTEEPTLVIGKGANINSLQLKYGKFTVEDNWPENYKFKTKPDIAQHQNEEAPIKEHVLDFEEIGKRLNNYSKELGKLQANEKTVKNNGILTLKSKKTSGTAVFCLNQKDISEECPQIDIDVNPGVVVLINVKGEVIKIPNKGYIKIKSGGKEVQDYSNILWNFDETQEIDLGLSYRGTILAPQADIKITSTGNMEGQLIAKSFTQPETNGLGQYAAYQSHLNLFTKNISIKDVKQSEEPSEKPEENPSEKPEENPSEKPEENPSEKPEENPSEKPEENPSEKPEENPNERPEENPSEKPDEKPSKEIPGGPIKELPRKENVKSDNNSYFPVTLVSKDARFKTSNESETVKTSDNQHIDIILFMLLLCAIGALSAFRYKKSI